MPQRVVAENGAFIGGRPGPQKGLCRRIGGETSRYGQFCRVSVQVVRSLGGHFPCLCRGFDIYEVKKKDFIIIFKKQKGYTFTLFTVKSLQKEQNSTNLLL
jgi:hypothetical protein